MSGITHHAFTRAHTHASHNTHLISYKNRQVESGLSQNKYSTDILQCSNQFKMMDPAVVCHGNCLETPGPPNPPQAQPQVLAQFGLKVCLFPKSEKQKTEKSITNNNNGRLSSCPSRVLISHPRLLCMNVNGCNESMQNRIINYVFHWSFLP